LDYALVPKHCAREAFFICVHLCPSVVSLLESVGNGRKAGYL
jgi:hypothetical protein